MESSQFFYADATIDVDHELLDARRYLLAQLIELDSALNLARWVQAEAMMSRFCAQLIDYAALSTYRIAEQTALAPHARMAIATTTRELMRFHDKFSRGTGNVRQSRGALEALALSLETRFELEDDLADSAAFA